MIDEDELDRRFNYHAPDTDAKRDAHTDVRRACREVAQMLDYTVPDGREKSVAMTKLEEVMFWANAGVARGEG